MSLTTALDVAQETELGTVTPALPLLVAGHRLSIKDLRDPLENFYLTILWFTNAIVFIVLAALGYFSPEMFAIVGGYGLVIALMLWISWKLTYAFIYGHGIEVGANQYPQVYSVVKQAADYLEVPVPTTIILQGHGMFELMVAKRFTRRGLIVITSNMLDEFCERPSSREFMMFVGRQLGHLKAGHFRWWFFKDVIGMLAVMVNFAYWRRCHLTADRIGMLVAGDLSAAEQALCIITAGARIAPGTNLEEIKEQRTRLFESVWAWLQLGLSTYPYMVDRIVRLRRYANEIAATSALADGRKIGALPIMHHKLRALPLLVIHGRDRVSLLELKDYLYSTFPQVVPRVMAAETVGALGLSEKFEIVAKDVWGAIAVVTPDDVGSLIAAPLQEFRPRQNVVIEIGWAWGRLGRHRCLLLVRGTVQLPSDLAGVDYHAFSQSPAECSDAVRRFVESLESESNKVA